MLLASGAELVGASTHFANIEDTLNHDYAQLQLRRFRQALSVLERLLARRAAQA